MTAKEYLKQIRSLDKKIQQRIEERDALLARATSTGSRGMKQDVIQTSVDGDQVGRIVDRYIDMEKQITIMINRLVNMRHKIIGQIQQLSNPRHIELLYLRYVKYMRLEEIACTMIKPNKEPYSYEHINRLHGQALQEFEKRFADDMEMQN